MLPTLASPPAMPFTDQVTEVSPVIFALNCVELPGVTAAPIGVTDTATDTGGGGGGFWEEGSVLTTPQPVKRLDTSKHTNAATFVRFIFILPKASAREKWIPLRKLPLRFLDRVLRFSNAPRHRLLPGANAMPSERH